jgi:formylglycine-generating enzyme required for sulfatase activity
MRWILLLLLFVFICITAIAEVFLYQGFEENVSDTWSYTANPSGMSKLVWWGRSDQPMGSATAQSEDWFWAGWDLDFVESTLTFETTALPIGYNYTLSFYYFTSELNPTTEYSRYAIAYDTGENWDNWVNLNPNTQAWTQVTIAVPATYFRLKVAAYQDGFSKYSHWDSFSITRTLADPASPVVSNLQVAQRTDGSGLVDIFYDLYDVNGDDATVSLLLSDNSGVSFDVVPDVNLLSGDIGDDIPMGTGKHIIWDAGEELTDFDANQFRLRVVAEDWTTYGTVATPTFSPPAGIYTTSQNVEILCATDGAIIRYTLDETEPNESSPVYAAPILIEENTTVKAKAYKDYWTDSETATAEYLVIEIPENFILVEGGTFHNGTSNITLSSFFIGKYEVTQAEYLAVMGTNPSHFSSNPSRPVEQVSWFKVIEYCNRLSIAEGLTPAYSYSTFGTDPDNWPSGWNTSNANHTNVSCNWSATGYRLPTEMEWMFAAKGGNQSQGYTYSGSNTVGDVAWYDSNSGSRTHDVGGKDPNELLTFDLSGNVWEWCWDIYGSYPSGAQTNPTGAASGSYRIMRGGSWNFDANFCTVASRNDAIPTNTYYNLGFRIIRTLLVKDKVKG